VVGTRGEASPAYPFHCSQAPGHRPQGPLSL
jgi:hypothetical protein